MRRPPVPLRALCAIARATFDPRKSDAAWREDIKCRLLAQGWRYPLQLEQIGQAMTQVEQALRREGRTRPCAW